MDSFIEFETIEDIELFTKELVSSDFNASNEQTTEMIDTIPISISSDDTVNGLGHVSKYSPFTAGNGLFCWKNIVSNFTAQYYPLAGYYTVVRDSIENIESGLEGLVSVTWHQTGAAYNVNDPTALTVDFTINGYYLFGIKIGDYEVGATLRDQWNMTSDDINDYLD